MLCVCVVCVCTYRCWVEGLAVLFQKREQITTALSHFWPPLAGHSNGTSIINSFSISPCLLVWCFFLFFFHLLITLCTQLAQIKEQLQSRSRKLELKGFSLTFYLSLSPHFSTLLFKRLRRAECWVRQCLPEPGRTLFTFFFSFISPR